VQAATGASPGRLNLALLACEPDETRTQFTRRDTSVMLTFRLTPQARRMFEAGGQDSEALSLQVASMEDAELFTFETAVQPSSQ